MDLEAERRQARKSRTIAVVVALALHVVFVFSIPEVRDSIEIALVAEGLIEEEQPEEEETPEPPPPPPPEPEPEPQRRTERVTPPETPPPTPETPPPPPPPEPYDFTDTVAVESNSGSSDVLPSTPPGATSRGQVGGQAGGTEGGTVGGTVGGTGTGPLTGANLSRRPGQPAGLTNAALQRNYPLGARRTSTSGRVVMRITVGPDGRLRSATTVRETPPGLGFAAACRDTLFQHDTGWTPGLDVRGVPGLAATTFSCTFDIAQ